MIALIGCVKSKAENTCQAKDMYISTLFKYSYQYARKHTDDIYILSAKYGLIKDTEIISPYEETLNGKSKGEKKRWAYKVYQQLEKEGILSEEFLLLAGENYSRYIRQKIKTVEPLKGMPFGKRLAFLKSHL